MPLHLLVKWGRWFLQIVDINVGNFNLKLTGRWLPQIVDRDSGYIYIQYIYNKKCGVSEPVRGRSQATELPCYYGVLYGFHGNHYSYLDNHHGSYGYRSQSS